VTQERRAIARDYLLIAIAGIAIAATILVQPIAQDLRYHMFADNRTFLSIPNFWNVVSNVPFVFAGAAGLLFAGSRPRDGLSSLLRPAYIVSFAGVLMTGFGSAWYHVAPDNRTLVWDRLPMTLAFMGLFTVIIGEHISAPRARKLLLPLLIAGATSVAYWAMTEARGRGDLRPYALVQFLPMVLIPLILLMYRSRFDRTAFIWWVVAIYAASKLLEHYDHSIFTASGIISGHSLKHIVAAVAPIVLLYGFAIRRPVAHHAGKPLERNVDKATVGDDMP
jgi:hypothetical protein